MTTTTAPTASPPVPLTFDERLALAALDVDARIADTRIDLADVIRVPSETPRPAAPSPYTTPIASVLHRARVRIETAGWCRTAVYDEAGAVCPIQAIRLEAPTRGHADDACVLLLDAIRRDFRHAETIPAWNAAQTSPAPVLLYLDRAAELAHNRNQ